MDMVTSAFQKLSAYPAFQQLVLDGLIGTDADDTAPDEEKIAKAWLFQSLDDQERPFRDPEGSGQCVILLSQHKSWSGPNRHNTAQFPQLNVLIYADSTRDADGAPITQDARRKAKHVAKRINPCFHRPGNDDHLWPGDYWVHASYQSMQLQLTDVPNTQAYTVRGEMTYEITTD
jgi:hypothetical protein